MEFPCGPFIWRKEDEPYRKWMEKGKPVPETGKGEE